jgi:TRAP-type C4-dicarboxylate transport system permease small subunit
MLVSRIPVKAAIVLQVLTTLLSLFIIGVMAWQGWVVGMEERTVSDMLRVPQFPFRMLVSVAGFFLFLELLLDLVGSMQKLIRS